MASDQRIGIKFIRPDLPQLLQCVANDWRTLAAYHCHDDHRDRLAPSRDTRRRTLRALADGHLADAKLDPVTRKKTEENADVAPSLSAT